MEDEIAKGEFDYAQHFPNSPRAQRFDSAPGARMALKHYLETWLTTSRQHLKASTWNGYKKIVRGQLIPAFGELTLGELRRRHVKVWAAEHGATKKTLGNVLSPLRVALDDAVEDELIENNPLAGWKIRRRDAVRRRSPIDPFSNEERTAILGALNGQGHNLIQFAFWTGLRTSELVALEWADIDWVREVVMITRAITQGAEEAEDTKTEAGEREVKLLSPALDALKAQKAYTFLQGREVFQNPRTGARWTGDQPIRKTLWEPALRRAGVRYRRPYQTRHSYASMLLMAGEDVRWVSQQLGHTDWAFTARTYTRFIPDDAPQAGRLAEALYGEQATSKPHGSTSS